VSDWLDALQRHRARGESAVLVSVVSAKGSVPRGPGTRMVVTSAGVAGTIGGGHLEFSAIGIARDMLAGAGAQVGEMRRFPLGASLGQCCGGLVNLLFEPVEAKAGWVGALAGLRRAGVTAVVASLADRAAADDATGRIIVTADTVDGTFDDAALQARVVDAARTLLATRDGARLARFSTDNDGANALVFLDPLRDVGFHLVLFGAGHVGRALVELLARIPCRVTWVDGRESEIPDEVPGNVTVVVTDTPEAEVDSAPQGTYFLVMTHSHTLDQTLAEAILQRGGFAYFGLIGSMTKRTQFERRMGQRGIPSARFADMVCPIGVAGIKGKDPATIAIAVAAQLLQVREHRMAGREVGGAAVNG
jgi:xanthine dehydrogenase accessory factor